MILSGASGGAEQRKQVERLGANTLRSDGVTSYRCEGRSPGV